MNEILEQKNGQQEAIDFLFENDARPLNYQTLLIKMSAGVPLGEQDRELLVDLHSFLGLLAQ